MHHYRPALAVKFLLVVVALAVSMLPFLTGCDLIDQLIGGGIPGGGTANAPQAMMTAQIDDDMVNRGLNPDHRPPLRYEFSAVGSLDQYGDPIHKPNCEVAWDFGDGGTRGFEWGDYTLHHIYREEGTYTATLTVREAPVLGNASDTAQKTITIGPAWLKIISLTTEPRTDGQFDVTVVVQNQSHQTLGRLAIDLIGSGGGGGGIDLLLDAAKVLPPGGVYTAKGVIGQWTGELRARSSWCYPVVN